MPTHSRPDVVFKRDRCPYCHESVRPETSKLACDSCMAWHHQECWQEHGKCSVCEWSQPSTETRTETIPQCRWKWGYCTEPATKKGFGTPNRSHCAKHHVLHLKVGAWTSLGSALFFFVCAGFLLSAAHDNWSGLAMFFGIFGRIFTLMSVWFLAPFAVSTLTVESRGH